MKDTAVIAALVLLLASSHMALSIRGSAPGSLHGSSSTPLSS